MTARIKNKIFFETLEDLKEQAIKDYACKSGLNWLNEQESLEEIFEKISLENRLWCLCQGYQQFIKDCDFDKFNGLNWSLLLCSQPQFSDKCNWEKLNSVDWTWLLIKQPQFSNKCNWKKFNSCNWIWLLQYQPQFAEFCDWEKLDDVDWTNLLREQPQLSKYKLFN